MLDAYRDLIDELLGTPSEIRGLIEADRGGEPSAEARRLIAEVRDRDRAILDRLHVLMQQRDPYLRETRPAPADPSQDVATLLDEMEAARGDLVSLLMNLTLKDWEREAIHETEGEVTLADEVERHVEFDEAQRQQMRQLFAGS